MIVAPAQGSLAAQGDPLSKARAATVYILARTIGGTSQGSGVVLTESGIIATNAHVIDGAQSVTIKLPSGETLEATGAIDYDPRLDLALIVVPGFGMAHADLGNSDSIAVGEHIFAIGAPLGLEQTVTDGVLSAVRIEDGIRRLQISTPVTHGSSGGPVVNGKGMVIGLVVSGIRGDGAENLNFAVPINAIRGKLALLAGHSFTPFSQLSYALARTSTATGEVGSSSTQSLNAGLNLAFESLDRVSLYAETWGDRGWNFKTVTTYAVSRSPTGVETLERYGITTGRAKVTALRSEDVQEETIRTVFDVSERNNSSSTYQLRHFFNQTYNRNWSLQIRGSRFAYANGSSNQEGEAPQGIFPNELVSAVIAALPDSMTDETHFWILDTDANRPAEVTVRVLQHTTLAVPFAPAGQKCSKSTTTTNIQTPILMLSVRVSTADLQESVLAKQPHIRVDLAKCVSIPNN